MKSTMKLRNLRYANSEYLDSASEGNRSLLERENCLVNFCGVCKKGFKLTDSIRNHMVIEHGVAAETLNRITYSIENQPNYFEHTAVEHLNLVCSEEKCKLTFTSETHLEIHKKCHGDWQLFACFICTELFANWPSCALHLDEKHDVECGLLKCHQCSMFKSWNLIDLKNHMRIHTGWKTYKCNHCDETFKQVTQLRSHSVIHSKQKQNRSSARQCLTCLKIFSNAKSLKKHKNEVHNKLRPFVCNICGHASARKWLLELHQRQHTGAKVHFCQICSYKTADQNSLRRHYMRHTGVRPYKCEQCQRTFVLSFNYKRHILHQHPESKGVLSCAFCSFRTVSLEKLARHVSDHLTGLIKKDDTLDLLEVPNDFKERFPLWFTSTQNTITDENEM